MLRFLAYTILLHSTLAVLDSPFEVLHVELSTRFWPSILFDQPPLREDRPHKDMVNVVVDKTTIQPTSVPDLKDVSKYFVNNDPKQPADQNGNPHHLRGIKKPYDWLLDYGWVRSIGNSEKGIIKIVKFENLGKISSVQVYDFYPLNNRTLVHISTGGVGQDFVFIRFEGYPNEEFNYFVKIYGEKK